MRFVEHFKPKVFVVENVPEILKSQEFVEIKSAAEKLGYVVREKILHAVEYGVPQKRRRAIIIASRIGTPEFPEATHAGPGQTTLSSVSKKMWRTVSDAIKDLPLEPNNDNWHVGRHPTEKSMARYKSVPPGGNRFDLPIELQPECWIKKKTGSTDVFGRLEWDKPSLTIRTEFFKPEKGRYLHPEAHRPITIREAARLQTFPDGYKLIGSHVAVAKQVGNAVPCELARNVGLAVLNLFESVSNKVEKQSVDGKPPITSDLTYTNP
jgi:DNA (cytosine-5)-methyltransferase 1